MGVRIHGSHLSSPNPIPPFESGRRTSVHFNHFQPLRRKRQREKSEAVQRSMAASSDAVLGEGTQWCEVIRAVVTFFRRLGPCSWCLMRKFWLQNRELNVDVVVRRFRIVQKRLGQCFRMCFVCTTLCDVTKGEGFCSSLSVFPTPPSLPNKPRISNRPFSFDLVSSFWIFCYLFFNT